MDCIEHFEETNYFLPVSNEYFMRKFWNWYSIEEKSAKSDDWLLIKKSSAFCKAREIFGWTVRLLFTLTADKSNKRHHLLLHQFVDLFFCSSYKSCHTDPNRVSYTTGLCETDIVSSFLLLRQPPASHAVFVQIVSCLHTYTIFFRVCKWGGGECLNLQLPQRINTVPQCDCTAKIVQSWPM